MSASQHTSMRSSSGVKPSESQAQSSSAARGPLLPLIEEAGRDHKVGRVLLSPVLCGMLVVQVAK